MTTKPPAGPARIAAELASQRSRLLARLQGADLSRLTYAQLRRLGAWLDKAK